MRKGWKIQSPAIIPGLPTTHHLKSAIHEGISITSMLVSDMSQWNLCRLKRGGNGFIFLGNCSSWISMIHEATSNIMDFIEKYPGLPFTIPHARRLVSDTCLSFRPIMWVAPRRETQQNLPDIFVCIQRAFCIGLKTIVLSYRLYQNLLESLIFKKLTIW